LLTSRETLRRKGGKEREGDGRKIGKGVQRERAKRWVVRE
jgi:hypothetical protein